MAFTKSGSIITQTGTDTNLNGLIAISGVNSIVTTSDTTQDAFTIIQLSSSLRLIVDGTLTIEPDAEQLIMEGEATSSGSSAPLRVNGTLNLGVAKSSGGRTIYSQGTGIIFTNKGANFFARDVMYVNNGGTFNWNGGIIRTAATVTIGNGGILNVYDGTIFNSTNDSMQFRVEPNSIANSNLINIYNLRYDGNSPMRIFTEYGFGTLQVELARGDFQPFNESIANGSQEVTLLNFDCANNLGNVDVVFMTQIIATNYIQNFSARPRYGSGTNGYYRAKRQMNCPVVNLAGSNIEYSYYGKDFNSGNRGASLNGDGDTSDIIYSGIDVTGNFDDNILVEACRSVSNVQTTDDRTNASDTIPVNFIAYNEAIGTFNPVLIGLYSYEADVILFPDTNITESSRSTVDAYVSIDTSEMLYDYLKSYLCANYAGESTLIASKSGSTSILGSNNLIINKTLGSTMTYVGSDISIKSDLFTGSSDGDVSVINGANIQGGTFNNVSYESGANTITNVTVNGVIDITQAGSYTFSGGSYANVTNSSGGVVEISLLNGATVATSSNVSLLNPRVGTITYECLNSRIQIYNVTTSTEIQNTVTSGLTHTYNYNEGTGISAGDTIRVRLTMTNGSTNACTPFEGNAVAGSEGFNTIASQPSDSIYITNAVDGSSVNTFTADYNNNEVDVVISNNFTSKEFYAWWSYNLTTEEGIREFFGAINAEDVANYRINTSILNVMFDITTSDNIYQSDSARIYRDDDAYPVQNPTSGGGAIDLVWRQKVLIVQTGVSGLTSSELDKLNSIDRLTKLIPASL